MIYVFHLLDKPHGAELRQRMRPEHKAYLGAVSDRIAFAGPLLADDGTTMIGSLLAIDFDSREAAVQWQASEPFTRAGLYASVTVHAFQNLWPQKTGFHRLRDRMIKHIVMWNVLGASADEKARNLETLKVAFEGLRGTIPGMLTLEIGVDQSRVDYACDVVLYSEFASADALAAYAHHPEHTRVRQALEGMRIARHQVDYTV